MFSAVRAQDEITIIMRSPRAIITPKGNQLKKRFAHIVNPNMVLEQARKSRRITFSVSRSYQVKVFQADIIPEEG